MKKNFELETTSGGSEAVSIDAGGQFYSILPELINQVYVDLVACLNNGQVERFGGRLDRGLQMALHGMVSFTGQPGVFLVNASEGGQIYNVDLGAKSCTCPDSRSGYVCKHRVASYLIQQSLKEAETTPLSVTATPYTYDPRILKSLPFGDATIWGLYHTLDATTQVEILEINGDAAQVRALPIMFEGELRPAFPFPSPFSESQIKWSTAVVLASDITNIQVFRGE